MSVALLLFALLGGCDCERNNSFRPSSETTGYDEADATRKDLSPDVRSSGVPPSDRMPEDALTREMESDARKILDRCDDDRDPESCAAAGHLFRHGSFSDGFKLYTHEDTDALIAVQLFQRACFNGDFFGCLEMSDMYRQGDGVPPDSNLARSILRSAYDMAVSRCGGDALSCHDSLYLAHRLNAQQAIDDFLQSCRENNALACLLLVLREERLPEGVTLIDTCDRVHELALSACADLLPAPRAQDILRNRCRSGEGRACQSLSRHSATTSEWREIALQNGCPHFDATSCPRANFRIPHLVDH